MHSLLYTLKFLAKKVNPEIQEELTEIHQEISNSIDIQQSSSSLLLMNVEDILGYTQAKAKKFSKVIKQFNIKTAIEETNVIYKYKADSQNIQLLS